MQGISRSAQPLDRLNSAFAEFKERVAARINQEIKKKSDEGEVPSRPGYKKELFIVAGRECSFEEIRAKMPKYQPLTSKPPRAPITPKKQQSNDMMDMDMDDDVVAPPQQLLSPLPPQLQSQQQVCELHHYLHS